MCMCMHATFHALNGDKQILGAFIVMSTSWKEHSLTDGMILIIFIYATINV